VRQVRKARWGFNTNLAKVIEMICAVLQSATPPLTPSEVPGIIIFSDMQFDECGGSHWETHCSKMKAKFHKLGMELVNEPYEIQLTFWNLRGDTNTFVSHASSTGVTMLSGFSSNLMKNVLDGNLNTDPLTVMLDIIRHKNFDDVREIASSALTPDVS
jgi:hypothetical protein